jgi:hypothetical protein
VRGFLTLTVDFYSSLALHNPSISSSIFMRNPLISSSIFISDSIDSSGE